MSATRVRVQVERVNNTWEIRYPGFPALQPRTLNLIPNVITLPQTTGDGGFDPGKPENLSLAINITQLKTPGNGDVARFGSYLFDVLIGSNWNAIAVPNPPSAIELVSSDPEFHRLPWEMAYGP